MARSWRSRVPHLAAIVLGLLVVAVLAWLMWSGRFHRAGGPAAPPRWPVAVSTIGGGGSPGWVDGVVSAALFSEPFGVAVDAEGNTYVTDAGDNNRVRRIAPNGVVTTVAGGEEGLLDGTGSEARFSTPSGIALSPDGTLVVADTGNNAIRRVTPQGVVTTIAGGGGRGSEDGTGPAARFDGPIGVAVARDGTVFVADTYNDSIRRVARDGTVTTIAGGAQPGFRDGAGIEARFDTPSGIASGPDGLLFIADTGNNCIRRLDSRGEVTTLGAGHEGEGRPDDAGVALWRPVGVAVDARGDLYVSDALGRVSLFTRDGRSRVIAGSAPGFADGTGGEARFSSPSGVAVDGRGAVRVADSDNYLVRALTPQGVTSPARDIFLCALPRLSPPVLGFEHVPWPVDPQEGWHEVTATLGEPRGSFGGDGRERLHAGVDVHADEGALVRAVHDEKVGRPIAASGYGELNEMVRVGLLSYVHVRVGRDRHDVNLDRDRFTVLYDDDGLASRIRLRRGTHFRLGDPIGTVNRFAHVHLGLGPRGAEENVLRFSLAEFGDHVPPTIPANGVWLLDEAGTRLAPQRGRVTVSGRIVIVAEAWDQVDRNERRRRLGVYSLGYQVLRKNGTPVEGFEKPRTTLVFDRLPQTPGAGGMVYAEGSGITVYGNRSTRFRYVVTNELRDGEVTAGFWDAGALAPGDYRLRVVARDIEGNTAARDVPVRVAQ